MMKMKNPALFVCVCLLFVLVSTPTARAQSPLSDTTGFVKMWSFSVDGHSTEGGEATLFINAKTKDSVVTVTLYFETGRAEYKFVFNKKLIDAECIDYHYDWQKVYEQHKIEITSIEKTNLKTSKKEKEELTEFFLTTKEELSKNAPIRQGFAYLDKGDNEKAPSYYDLAVKEFNNALRLDDLDYSLRVDAYAGRGRAYLRKGDNRQAVTDFDKAIEMSPYNAIYLSNRGRAYARMGDYDKAVADFEAAAKLDPKNQLIKQNLERAKKREKGL